MAKINDVELTGFNLRVVSIHRNEMIDAPGSDTNYITDMGYDGLVLRMEGFETTLAEYDAVIAEFMKPGDQTLVIRTGWQYSVHSVQLTPVLLDGYPDNYFPYDLILITSTPYRESTAVSCRAKEITANNQEWMFEDVPCDNLLDNWSFEDWTDGTSVIPDSWSLTVGTITRSSDSVIGTYSAAVTRSGNSPELIQTIANPTNYIGSVITIGCWVKSAIAGGVVGISINTDAGSSTQDLHTNGGAWEWLKVSYTILAGTTYIRADLEVFTADGTAYFDGVTLVEGTSIRAPINNILTNHSFEDWTSGVPDDWTEITLSISQVTGKHGNYACSLTNTDSAPGYIDQSPNHTGMDGKTVTFGSWVKTDVNNRCFLQIFDQTSGGYESTSSSYHTGSGEWEWLEATRTLRSSLTDIICRCSIISGTSISASVDQAIFIECASLPDDICDEDIRTSGNVDAIPNIQVQGNLPYEYELTEDTDATEYPGTTSGYILKKTFTYTGEISQIFELLKVGLDLKRDATAGIAYGRITYQCASLNGGAETQIQEWTSTSSTYATKAELNIDMDIAKNETITIRFYTKCTSCTGGSSRSFITALISNIQQYTDLNLDGIKIYNTADPSVISNMGNALFDTAKIKVNTDGTGTYYYKDDFQTKRYIATTEVTNHTVVTHSSESINLAVSSWVYWPIDTKYPITGIPTLISQINTTAGTPTIQISSDASTWYDIDTAIVDDVLTTYDLDNAVNLSLKGKTLFYLKINCGAGSTCVIKDIELDADLVTIDAEHPKIDTGATPSKFRCDQDSNSEMDCVVSLSFNDRSWAG